MKRFASRLDSRRVWASILLRSAHGLAPWIGTQPGHQRQEFGGDMKKLLALTAIAMVGAATMASAQPPGGGGGNNQPYTWREDQLDPSPVGAATDPIAHITGDSP